MKKAKRIIIIGLALLVSIYEIAAFSAPGGFSGLPWDDLQRLVSYLRGQNNTFTGNNTFTSSVTIGTSVLSTVSSYQTAGTAVTINPNLAKTHIIYLNGAATTTGVSVTLTTPTIGVNQEGTYTLVFQQPAANSCDLVWTNSNLKAPSGTSPSLTNTTGATDFVTAKYNSMTGFWYISDGPYDVK